MLSTFAPTAITPRFLARDAAVLSTRPSVTRWLAVGVRANTTRELPRAKGRLVVHCRHGEVWITHDGEQRDIVLRTNECYVVDGDGRMTAHALNADAGLELQLDA